jgi:hypothetical protein
MDFDECVKGTCPLIVRSEYKFNRGSRIITGCHGETRKDILEYPSCRKGFYVCDECFPRECAALDPENKHHFIFRKPEKGVRVGLWIHPVDCRRCGSRLFVYYKYEDKGYTVKAFENEHVSSCIMLVYPFPCREEIVEAKVGKIQWV